MPFDRNSLPSRMRAVVMGVPSGNASKVILVNSGCKVNCVGVGKLVLVGTVVRVFVGVLFGVPVNVFVGMLVSVLVGMLVSVLVGVSVNVSVDAAGGIIGFGVSDSAIIVMLGVRDKSPGGRPAPTCDNSQMSPPASKRQIGITVGGTQAGMY